MSFDNLLKVAGQIISSFGTYWVFMWNCQDFVAWYLNFIGIPLEIIDPKIPDKMRGSGTNSSARKVQSFKRWMYYDILSSCKKMVGRTSRPRLFVWNVSLCLQCQWKRFNYIMRMHINSREKARKVIVSDWVCYNLSLQNATYHIYFILIAS